MTKEQIGEAVDQMRSFCADMEAGNDYTSIPARGVLYKLGYTNDEADEVLKAIHAEGFSYCLDSMFPSKDGEGTFGHTPMTACYWGPDQLRSRLNCVSLGTKG